MQTTMARSLATLLLPALLAALPLPAQGAAGERALQQRVAKAIVGLEHSDRHDAALADLLAIGPTALPLLDAALLLEAARGQTARLQTLQAARAAMTGATNLFDFAEPVTLVADYSDNRVFAVDAAAKVVFELDDVYGAWDAEITPQQTLLITEFSVSRVREVDRSGKELWCYENLKNPYDADRLPNGNTLIADTFGSRVIEIDKDKQVVWQLQQVIGPDGTKSGIRPFDVDRLANGNTLIADVLHDRVIEVSPAGAIVWQIEHVNNVHDADRLPNGNTLITLRNSGKVLEVDPTGKTVWQLDKLSSPSDADRLPNGNTLVAENTQVREFDKDGALVWKYATSWAVEANRY